MKDKRPRDYWNPKTELMPKEQLRELQLRKLKATATWAYERSPLWKKKFGETGLRPEEIRSLEDIEHIPFLTKDEWLKAQEDDPLFGDTLAAPLQTALRYHQTSGTSGRTPLRVLDSRKDWDWQAEMWAYGLYAFGIRSTDVVYVPFSYGVFIGFWGAHYAAEKIGALVIPGGGYGSEARLKQIIDLGVTAVVCTPTYALHLAQVAAEVGIDLTEDSRVEMLIHAGEPGANIPNTKKAIEDAWGAKAGDFVGMTESGTIFAFECNEQCGAIHIIEDHFYEQVVDPATGKPLGYGQKGERVMTSFGRGIIPCMRYRTGDLVERVESTHCSCGRTFDLYQGGILGRIDDMKIVRGVNVYPTAVENIVREYREINEFQITIARQGPMDEIVVKIEPKPKVPRSSYPQLMKKLSNDLSAAHEGLRFNIVTADPGTLPTFELKARRLQDLRPPIRNP
ncbi:MAG: phenylacetate--CoA ligase family protein [Chloroflexi bacterium]|nr:phenylacetate--CoA ligase family protein [Chloroflexota bacterium]